MDVEAAVKALDAINTGDNEQAHMDAEGVLVKAVHPDIRAAYERCARRTAPWWWA